MEPFHGGWNARYIKVTGQIVIEGLAQGEVGDVTYQAFGDEYATLGGEAGTVETTVALAIWTGPMKALVEGFSVAVLAQDEGGFWYQVTRDAAGAVATFTWDWEVRGAMK